MSADGLSRVFETDSVLSFSLTRFERGQQDFNVQTAEREDRVAE
jgi:hypothetical protein